MRIHDDDEVIMAASNTTTSPQIDIDIKTAPCTD